MSDLISRKKVLALPRNKVRSLRTHEVVEETINVTDIEHLPSAQPDNQTNLCDSCDYSYPDCPSKYDDVIFGNGIGNDNICACNKYKPSAQPERKKGKWIPCSKRMPEEREWIGTKTFGTTISDEVYVTFESPKGERFTKHLSFQNGKVSNFTQREIDVFYKGAVPIAWMPLPEPYRGGEKDE